MTEYRDGFWQGVAVARAAALGRYDAASVPARKEAFADIIHDIDQLSVSIGRQFNEEDAAIEAANVDHDCGKGEWCPEFGKAFIASEVEALRISVRDLFADPDEPAVLAVRQVGARFHAFSAYDTPWGIDSVHVGTYVTRELAQQAAEAFFIRASGLNPS